MSIAAYIKQDLIASILSGKIHGERLTLDALSQRYQVSTRPVRAAVQDLIDEEYLKKGGGGRLVICSKPIGGAISPPEMPIDWSGVITNDLIQISLEGTPVLLREESTAEKYGISRFAIRQIFQRLAGRGILKHLPRRGWELRPFRQEDLDAYIRVRVGLELMALELAWPRLVDEELQAIYNRNGLPENPDSLPVVDNSLHAYLIEKSRNPFIADFFERHGVYYNALFRYESYDRDASIQTVVQHREILEALLRRDRDAAERTLANHIRKTHSVLLANRPKSDGIDNSNRQER
ncbi:MAG: GntR family transcriptional regulator [Pirellulales bacterium]|nr:GntR family transcriptional regulator [Pirellulales bacterium]